MNQHFQKIKTLSRKTKNNITYNSERFHNVYIPVQVNTIVVI